MSLWDKLADWLDRAIGIGNDHHHLPVPPVTPPVAKPPPVVVVTPGGVVSASPTSDPRGDEASTTEMVQKGIITSLRETLAAKDGELGEMTVIADRKEREAGRLRGKLDRIRNILDE